MDEPFREAPTERMYYPRLDLRLVDRKIVTSRMVGEDAQSLYFMAKPTLSLRINGNRVEDGRVAIVEGRHERDGKERIGGIDGFDVYSSEEATTPAGFSAAVWVDHETYQRLLTANLNETEIFLGLELYTEQRETVEVDHIVDVVTWDLNREKNIWLKKFEFVVKSRREAERLPEAEEKPQEASKLHEQIHQLVQRVAGIEKTLLWIFGVLVAIGIMTWMKR